MKLFNTLDRQVTEFHPQAKDYVSFYSCGPTVYGYPHIGNWTGYIYWDTLVRVLTDEGLRVNWYMNVTDVGHLVSDADEGEDKLQKTAREKNQTAWEVAEFYTKDFIEGMKQLNISFPLDHLVKATDHIDEQIQLIQQLEAKGFTYKTDDGIYFESTKFAGYGKMARLDIAGLQAGARVNTASGKKHATDFALWKFSPADQNRDMEWDSPWGEGFPGWHIECSAMAMKYLGNSLDLHAGGIDHIPVHHTNEIAQSEAATGAQFVRYWLHNNHMMINEEKIAKSAGNGITLIDIQEKGFSPLDFRLFVLQSHYRTQSNFKWELLQAAQSRRQSLQAFADLRFQLQVDGLNSTSLDEARQQIQNALRNDLGTPQALAVLSELEAKSTHGVESAGFHAFIDWLDSVLGLQLGGSADITDGQKQLIQERLTARRNSDFAEADRIRDDLRSQGIALRDLAHTSLWSRT